MIEMRLSPCGFRVDVTFEHPIPAIIQKIKLIPGARYNPDSKVWRMPLKQFMSFYTSASEEFLTMVHPPLTRIRDKNLGTPDYTFKLPLVEPKGFKPGVKLKQHQIEALSHVVHHKNKDNSGSIIAISIGGGKTMVGIGAQRYFEEPAIVVCPISLKTQWAREIERFTGASVRVVDHVKPQKRHDMWNEIRTNPEKYDFVITHYQQLMNDFDHIPQRKIIIIDEAHRYKNPKAKMTKAMNLYAKDADVVVMLTGTFLINHKHDGWNLMNLSGYTFEKSFYMFCQKHCHIDNYGNPIGSKQSMRPFMRKLEEKTYHRPKSEILKHLPPVNNCMHWLKMDPIQQKFYDELEAGDIAFIDSHDDISNMQIEGVWTRLRQAATIPQVIKKLDLNGEPIEFKIPEESIKLKWLEDFMEDFEDDHFILYCPFTSVLDYIQKKWPNKPWIRIDGSVPGAKRQALIDKGKSQKKSIFLITDALKEGANMQFCHDFIFFSLPLTDADRAQLQGRVDREGQEHSVNVHWVLVENSIDGAIYNKLEGKKDLMRKFGASVQDNAGVLRMALAR
jgi:SNF2 family DNA or RNA helicase